MLLTWPRQKQTSRRKKDCWVFCPCSNRNICVSGNFCTRRYSSLFLRWTLHSGFFKCLCKSEFFNAHVSSQFIGRLNAMPKDRSPLPADVIWSKYQVMPPGLFLSSFMSSFPLLTCFSLRFYLLRGKMNTGALSLYLNSHVIEQGLLFPNFKILDGISLTWSHSPLPELNLVTRVMECTDCSCLG